MTVGGGVGAGLFLLALLVAGCLDEQPAHLMEDIHALKGKSPVEVRTQLGEPRVIDTTAGSHELIWGYYQKLIAAPNETTPRQRTILIVFRKHDEEWLVSDVKTP